MQGFPSSGDGVMDIIGSQTPHSGGTAGKCRD